MLVSEIYTEVKELCKDEEGRFVTEVGILRWANVIQNKIVAKTGCLRNVATITTAANTQLYSLDSNCFKLYRVTYGSDEYKLFPVNFSELDAYKQKWHSASSGTPAYYFLPYTGKIGFFPIPDTASVTIDCWFIKIPTALTTAAGVPFDSATHLYPYHDLIVKYCCYIGWLKQGDKSQALMYKAEFKEDLEDMIEEVNNMFKDKIWRLKRPQDKVFPNLPELPENFPRGGWF